MSTTVRNLTEGEMATLAPLVRDLAAHIEGCDACQSAPVPSTAAELGEANLCAVGADMYRRWLEWLARS